MNLFVVGRATGGTFATAAARDSLAGFLERLPFFPEEPVRTWGSPSGRVTVAWVQHAPERVGDVEYVAARAGRLALFSGRPVRWDGGDPLDARGYLEPVDSWASALDGRYVVVRVGEDDTVDVVPDALGAYPVYEAVADGTHWVSNNPELLHELAGDDELDPSVVASLLGGGWSLSGNPVWRSVRRIGGAGDDERLPLARIVEMTQLQLEAREAADDLVEVTRALADWPGRPSVVPVTGGRDSRLVLAAAIRAGIDYTTNTGGVPGHPDVDIGRELARVAGVPHSLIEDDPHGSLHETWERAAKLLAVTAAGTASLSDAAGFPFGPRTGPLPLWHSGQGGEIARGYYDDKVRDGSAESLFDAFTGRRPGREAPLNGHGRQLVRAQIEEWVSATRAPPEHVGDLFYTLKRMGTWAGPSHGAVEYVRDTTSPLWSTRLLPHELAVSGDGARSEFHLRVMEELAPELVDVPFEDGRTWPSRQGELARRAERARVLTGKVRGELKRRAQGRRAASSSATPAAADSFTGVLHGVRDLVAQDRSHPAWELLDRGKVEALVAREPVALDAMSRYYVWRLATVFTTAT